MRRSARVRTTTVSALAALLLLGAAGPPVAAEPGDAPPPVPVRVASYNIAAGAGTDRVFDIDRTAAAIAELDADVIGLQEVDRHWGARSLDLDLARELADRLDMHVGYAPIYSFDPPVEGAPRREFGVAILSAHPILEFTNHDLTRLSTQDPQPVPRPMPGFAEAVVQVQGARVHVYSTHLDYRADPTVRELQVADTLAILDQDPAGASQVLVGDLNARPHAPELAPLWDVVTDAWRTADGDGATYPATAPDRRIDYVTVAGGVEVVGATVPDTALATTASDHRPVVADLLLPRGVQR